MAFQTALSTQIIEFAGIELDVRLKETRLSLDKIEKCTSFILHSFLTRDKCTIKEMQSLIGTLNFACAVILPGRAFLRRFTNLLMNVSKHQRFITISRECKEDMCMWLAF